MKRVVEMTNFNSLEAMSWFIDRMVDIFANPYWYMLRMHQIGYKVDFTGMCFGITHMAIQAFLTDDIKTFNQRLETIQNIPIFNFTDNFAKLREQRDEYAAQGKTREAEEIRAKLIDISAFFDGVALHQKPELLGSATKRQDASITLPVLCPVHLDSEKNKPVLIRSFIGSYDKSELIAYLHSLQQHLGSHSFSLYLEASQHCVSLHFNQKSSQRLLIDPNKLPGVSFSDLDKLADALLSAFCQTVSQGLVMKTMIYTNNQYKHQIEQDFSRMQTTSQWQSFNSISANKILKAYSSDSWFLRTHHLVEQALSDRDLDKRSPPKHVLDWIQEAHRVCIEVDDAKARTDVLTRFLTQVDRAGFNSVMLAIKEPKKQAFFIRANLGMSSDIPDENTMLDVLAKLLDSVKLIPDETTKADVLTRILTQTNYAGMNAMMLAVNHPASLQLLLASMRLITNDAVRTHVLTQILTQIDKKEGWNAVMLAYKNPDSFKLILDGFQFIKDEMSRTALLTRVLTHTSKYGFNVIKYVANSNPPEFVKNHPVLIQEKLKSTKQNLLSCGSLGHAVVEEITCLEQHSKSLRPRWYSCQSKLNSLIQALEMLPENMDEVTLNEMLQDEQHSLTQALFQPVNWTSPDANELNAVNSLLTPREECRYF